MLFKREKKKKMEVEKNDGNKWKIICLFKIINFKIKKEIVVFFWTFDGCFI